jgi:hypothetical protein
MNPKSSWRNVLATGFDILTIFPMYYKIASYYSFDRGFIMEALLPSAIYITYAVVSTSLFGQTLWEYIWGVKRKA